MHFKAKITIKQNNVTTNEIALEPTQTAKVVAAENMQVSLLDIETGKPITKLQAKNSGNDLVIADESGEEILTIENYYSFDNIEVGTLTNESFVRFATVDPASGKAISLVSETSYTPLVTDMLGNASVQNEMTKDSLSNGKVWGGIGALAIGASAISLSNSDDGKDGAIGPQGEAGQDGKSAYEVAVEYGYQGSFEQWVAEMKGEDYVDPTNTLPNANDTSIRTKEDFSFSGKLSPATDSDGDKLQYDLTEQAKNGTAVINKDGSFIYFPDRDYNGEDSFTYSISDGRGGVITKTANITIDAVNDAPESENTIISLSSAEIIQALEDGKLIQGQLAEATDVDGDDLVYFLDWYLGNGNWYPGPDYGNWYPGYRDLIIEEDGSYSIGPYVFLNYMSPYYGASLNDVSGEAIFSYTISDGNGGQIIRDAILEFKNAAPTSENTNIETSQDFTVNGRLFEAIDIDNDRLTYALEQKAKNGKVVVHDDGSYSYTPNSGFIGQDSFTYIISDNYGGKIVRTANVEVVQNNIPVAEDTLIEAVEGTVKLGMLEKASDADGDSLVYKLKLSASNGDVTVNEDGSYSYTPHAGFIGKDKFSYIVDDNKGGTIELEAIIIVSSNNSPPVSKDSYISIEDGLAYEGRLEAATDADGDELTYSVDTGPVNGKLVLNADGSFSYTPNSNYNGIDTFIYTINDGNGGVIEQKATLAIGNVNHAPVSQIDREGTITLNNTYGSRGSVLKYTTDDELIFISGKNNGFVFERYDSAGDLLQTTDLKELQDYYWYLELIDASITRDGGMVVLFKNSTTTEHFILRLDKEGNIDYTFSPAEGEQSPQGFIKFNYKIFVDSISSNDDGEIVISGSNKIIKFSPEGVIDSSFNSEGWGTGLQGVVQTKSNGWSDKVQLLDSGDILYSSSSYLAKYDTNGVLLNEYNGNSSISDIVVLDDGAVLVLFYSVYNREIDMIKLNKDLSIDTSFSITQEVPLILEAVSYFKAEKLIANSEGEILVIGRGEGLLNNNSVQVFVSFNSDGSLNESFKEDSSNSYSSILIKDIDRTYYGNDDVTDSLHIDSRGNLLVGNNLDGSNLTITKYLQSGIVANDFGPKADLGVLQNTDYIFQVDDFGFKDADGDSLEAVFIDEIPEKGELLLNGVDVTEGQRINAADIENGHLIFRPEKVIIQDDYASLTYRVQDDGGTENGAIDISHNQATLVIDVLPSTGPRSDMIIAAELYNTNALLVNMENSTINPYLYNEVSTDSSSQAGYSTWIEQPKNLPMLKDVFESSAEQLFSNSNGRNTSEELGASELQQEGSSALGLVVTQPQDLEQSYITEQASYII